MFIFSNDVGHDTILDFSAGIGSDDTLHFQSRFSSYEEVLASSRQENDDVIIEYDANNSITLKNVQLSSLHQDDFVIT